MEASINVSTQLLSARYYPLTPDFSPTGRVLQPLDATMPPKQTSAKPKPTRRQAPPSKASKQEEVPPTLNEQPEAAAPAAHDKLDEPKERPPLVNSPSSAPQSNMAKKRKSPASQEDNSTRKSTHPTKTPRQGTRTSTRTNKASSSSSPTRQQIITCLLSPSSLPHAYPEEELSFARSNRSTKTYSLTSPNTFTPFQHLLSASLLSKPLSHVLGLRSIRTLLNGPFSLVSPAVIASVGEHRVWEALEAARTQHRQKTAAYIYQMGKMCQEGESDGWGEELQGLQKMGGVQDVAAEIRGKIKGMGGTGAEVFVRRVQCCEGWEGMWPFADVKALEAVKEIGVKDVQDAAQLRSLIEEVVEGIGGKLGDMGLQGLEKGVSKEQMVRVAFVVVLERALGASLEGRSNEIRKAATESS